MAKARKQSSDQAPPDRSAYRSVGLWRASWSLVAWVAKRRPRAVASLFGLGVLLSFLEGVALVLLLPLLTALGVGTGAQNPLVARVTEVFQLVGVPFTLGAVLVFLLLLSLVTATIALMQTWIADATYRSMVTELQIETYTALLGSSADHLSRQKSGEVFTVMTKFIEQTGNSFVLLVRFMTSALLLTALITLALIQAWQLVLITLALIVPLLIPLRFNARAIDRLVFKYHSQLRVASARLSEHVDMALTIKAFGAERQSGETFLQNVRVAEGSMVRLKRRLAAAKSLMDPVVLGMLCLTIYLGSNVLAVPVERLLLLAAIFVRVMPLLLRMSAQNQQLPLGLAAYDAVTRLQSSARDHQERAGGVQVPQGLNAIELVDASVERAGKPILHGISMRLAPGSITGLVGASGAGKSSVVAALLGLARVTSGSIRIGGVELDQLNLQTWREQVGYMSQDALLFGDSIRHNMLFAKPDATDAEIWDALDAAGVGQFVRGLSEGLEAKVGSQGRLVSGGERQRLALARALIRRPAQLILDEPASALDPQTTLFILKTIEANRGIRTQLVIAHDLALVRDSDMIYVMDHGRIVESGSWAQLVAGRGMFYNLAMIQGRLSPGEIAAADDRAHASILETAQ